MQVKYSMRIPYIKDSRGGESEAPRPEKADKEGGDAIVIRRPHLPPVITVPRASIIDCYYPRLNIPCNTLNTTHALHQAAE